MLFRNDFLIVSIDKETRGDHKHVTTTTGQLLHADGKGLDWTAELQFTGHRIEPINQERR